MYCAEQNKRWLFNSNFEIYYIRMCGTWLCLRVQEGIQDGYQMIYTPVYFNILSSLLSKYVFSGC